MFYPLLAREGSDSLDVRGFAGRHNSKRYCPLLQYVIKLFYSNNGYASAP